VVQRAAEEGEAVPHPGAIDASCAGMRFDYRLLQSGCIRVCEWEALA
jgi:hypothetical protein